jgi:hypothetical protein
MIVIHVIISRSQEEFRDGVLHWRLVAPGKYLLLLGALQIRVRKPLKMKQK